MNVLAADREPGHSHTEAGEIVGDEPALISEGEYRLRYDGWQTAICFGKQAKLTLWFTVTSFGTHFGVKIPRYYNLKGLVGKPGRFGRFKVGRNSDLVREYARLIPLPSRIDRLNPDRLSKLLIVGKVETVKSDRAQEKLAQSLHYSVVRKLMRVEAGA